MKLLIVESPAKAKTISKYLEGEYTVKASVGHIRDLPKSNKNAIDIEGGFIPRYIISEDKKDIVTELEKLSKKSEEILLATDPDREGEAIAWHIQQACNIKNPKRVVFHEITKNAVAEAVKHPRKIDDNLRKAQEARRVLDRLVGYELSGLIWKKVRYGLSAGRVQSPALRIIMEREREIRNFIPEKFWIIEAILKTNKNEKINFVCSKRPSTQEETDEILKNGGDKNWIVREVKTEEAHKKPKAPFTTSTLQQTASSRLGLSPSMTMRIAQGLYEKGLITYMRTDSTNLSKEAISKIKETVSKKYGPEYFQEREYKTKSKNAQEAHEAIRPTDPSKISVEANDREKKLYNLIWQRAISSQMTDAKVLRTKVIANTEQDSVPNFSVNGSTLLFDGWLKADPDSAGEETILPKIENNQKLQLEKISSEAKETEPPARYSEAGLVKELEKRGIGRPSTYASIIQTIISRGYVEKKDRSLVPTDTGEVVSDFLEKNFEKIISDDFTAKMEEDLDNIANGDKDYVKTLKTFYEPFHKEVKEKDKLPKVTVLGEADSSILCPKCKSKMVIKLSKSGKFLSCIKFPECEGARTIDGQEMEGPKETGEKCPDCKDGKLVQRHGKYGNFVSCSNYPKCKYIKKDKMEIKGTGIKCPRCKEGEMAERRGRFGTFYSCSRYPECKYAIKTKPTGKYCTYIKENGEACGELMMEGTKTIPERCSDKNCPNHNPHKLNKENK